MPRTKSAPYCMALLSVGEVITVRTTGCPAFTAYTPKQISCASHNGKSNYFAKFSPDGKWIIFCKAENYMLLTPDSELYIIPAAGGEARRLRANTPRMNSWHSCRPTAAGSSSRRRPTPPTPSCS